ncbi:MAG TPA: hypothetical protein VLG09_05990 [Candidatus Saccharimonadales bacterium]|nr:hypothetical protein [Candidatus Saccharimonadales bacterium]
MRVNRNLLLQPQDALRIEEIEGQLKWCDRAAGTTATVAMCWAVCFTILVWGVVGYDYSWSPLSWLGPLGLIIASSGAASVWCTRKLHTERRRLLQQTAQFVIRDEVLNRLKSRLQILANRALHLCVIPEQQERVLSAYCVAAQELMYLDSAGLGTSQNEVIGNFREHRNTLRTIGDEIAGERERSLP